MPLRSSFTLIELLVVIAILAVLATAVVLVLNPAQLLAQGRDSTRLSDLASLQSALSLFVADTGGNQSLGSSTLTYLSLPEPGGTTDCSDLGFPSGYFHCAPASTTQKTDGSGWIPVNLTQISSGSPLSKLPLDPINTSSTHLYYSYWTNGTTYKVSALPESQKYASQAGQNPTMFQQGSNLNLGGGPNWALVPGNSQFGTPNFYVMQYDAGCSDGNGNPVNTPSAQNSTVYNDGTTNCIPSNGRQIASIPGTNPIGYISHNTALSYCQSIGAHLLTNDEYMTIATNAANQSVNWSGGSVGSSYMPQGNKDNVTGAMLSGINQYGTGYSDFHHLRTLTLSNGSVVWDISGNIWEHVQRSTMNQGDNTNTITTPTCSSGTPGTWEWCEYSGAGGATPYVTTWNDSSFSAATVGPPPNSNWNSNQSIGRTWSADGATGGQVFTRGGLWDTSSPGLFALSTTFYAVSQSSQLGFRCAR